MFYRLCLERQDPMPRHGVPRKLKQNIFGFHYRRLTSELLSRAYMYPVPSDPVLGDVSRLNGEKANVSMKTSSASPEMKMTSHCLFHFPSCLSTGQTGFCELPNNQDCMNREYRYQPVQQTERTTAPPRRARCYF